MRETESDGELTETKKQVDLIADDVPVINQEIDGRFSYVCEYSSINVQIAVSVPAAQVGVSGLDLRGLLHRIRIEGEPDAYRLSILQPYSMWYLASATTRGVVNC